MRTDSNLNLFSRSVPILVLLRTLATLVLKRPRGDCIVHGDDSH